MKKKNLFTAPLLILLFLCPLLLLTACSFGGSSAGPQTPEPEEVVYHGKIMQNTGESLLLAGAGENADSAELYRLGLKELSVYGLDGGAAEPGDLTAGALVDVVYDGSIIESFPAQFSRPVKISVTALEDDLTGLYLQIIDDLYRIDPGLNDGISLVAFDLSAVENLSPSEKSALLYLTGNAYGLETRAATYKELVEEGLIDEENLYFEKGLLFTFDDMEFSDQSFTFDVKKWRSGLGAYYFVDCTAEKGEAGWDYSVGQEAIS